MWYLTSENDKRVMYIITSKDEITIGRSIDAQQCNFAISEDASISRKHAILSILDGHLVVQDLGSRYGTFLNDSPEKIESNTKVIVSTSDVIKFGKLNSIWKVHETNFVTCTSTLKGDNLVNLRTCLSRLGGLFKNEWDDTCTYLTMPAITLTIKVVLALVQGSYIITTDFWKKCLEAVNNNTQLPNPLKFIPQVIESTLNKENVSFTPNENRKVLFRGKKFVFFSRKQFDMYNTVLIKSSASAYLLSESKMTKSDLCDPDIVVIQYNINSSSEETQVQKTQIYDIVNYMKTKGKRVVADAEIGLAILYCSNDKYCNPDFNFSSEVIKQTECNAKSANILAHESEEVITRKENVMVNETLTPNNDTSSNAGKRKWSTETDENSNANKKMAIEDNKLSNKDGTKRKFNEDNQIQSNPTKRQATGNDEELFNFTTSISTNKDKENKNSEMLSFSKPQKRKCDFENKDTDDGLFNFVEGKLSKLDSENKKTDTFDEHFDSFQKKKRLYDMGNAEDISALRGAKLKELMESIINYNSDVCNLKYVKKEIPDELDEQMSNLDLGTTIVKVRADLIVKKEPLVVEAPNNTMKNFKKFKKVWPVKMQVTTIS